MAIRFVSRGRVIAELLALPPEAQASDVIHRYVSQTSYIEVPDPAILTDIDDRTAYAELMAARRPAQHRHEEARRILLITLLVACSPFGLIAPFLRADRLRPRIEAALEAALNRPVHIGAPCT